MNAMNNISQPAGYRVDVSRGQRIDRVSREWMTRPDDERFTDLDSLHAAVRSRREASKVRSINCTDIVVKASPSDPYGLTLEAERDGTTIQATNWSFGQLCRLVGAPAGYLQQLPAFLAGVNLQHGISSYRGEIIKTMEVANPDGAELRAITTTSYGRIWDQEVVEAVQRIAGNGVGDTRWKVPGVLDWSTMRHNPHVDVTKETTTLFAADRNVFMFLVDDENPIECGHLPDGSPDLFFRGFYAWNSEVGERTAGIAVFYLRAVCQNRNLWGVENFQELRIRHSKNAAHRFDAEARPALERFANASPKAFIEGMKTSRAAIVARTDDERKEFLRKEKFSQSDVDAIIKTVNREEGHPPTSVFDFVQGITAFARTKPHQDDRIATEMVARRILDAVA